jgi:TRAP-type C4-dicarboxylate transport system permease large subunit
VRSSAGEHYLHTVGVTGSIPVAPTILSIGGLTPPVGGLMYITCSIVKVRIGDFVKALTPLLIAQLIVLLLLTIIPALSTVLPNLLMGH